MEITGTIHRMFETQQVTDKFKKRELILMTADNVQYPEFPKFEFHQDKCVDLDTYSMQDKVKIYFDCRGRRWEDPKGGEKWFTTLIAWRIERIVVEAHGHSGIDNTEDMQDENGDLPF